MFICDPYSYTHKFAPPITKNGFWSNYVKTDFAPKDFVHTENVVLVDKEKRLRGFYDATSFDEIDRLKSDIVQLKEEYE